VGFSIQGKAKALFRIWSLCVAFSILTVKQHFIVDLAGGALTAAFSMFLARSYLGRPGRAEV
jgi:membrane-associated phospholipid phosphatase